jgi:hypothetical protein
MTVLPTENDSAVLVFYKEVAARRRLFLLQGGGGAMGEGHRLLFGPASRGYLRR